MIFTLSFRLDQRIIDKVFEEWRKRFRVCVVAGEGVLLLQRHKLEASFATLQRLCRWSADPAYPIRSQRVLVARGRPWFWSSTPVVVTCPSRSCSSVLKWNIVAVRKFSSEHDDIIFIIVDLIAFLKFVERKQRCSLMQRSVINSDRQSESTALIDMLWSAIMRR